MLTVISSSALELLALTEVENRKLIQYLEEIICLLVCLSEQTQGESRHCVVAPRPEQGNEKYLPILYKVSVAFSAEGVRKPSSLNSEAFCGARLIPGPL
jgi:hypothetical protein